MCVRGRYCRLWVRFSVECGGRTRSSHTDTQLQVGGCRKLWRATTPWPVRAGELSGGRRWRSWTRKDFSWWASSATRDPGTSASSATAFERRGTILRLCQPRARSPARRSAPTGLISPAMARARASSRMGTTGGRPRTCGLLCSTGGFAAGESLPWLVTAREGTQSCSMRPSMAMSRVLLISVAGSTWAKVWEIRVWCENDNFSVYGVVANMIFSAHKALYSYRLRSRSSLYSSKYINRFSCDLVMFCPIVHPHYHQINMETIDDEITFGFHMVSVILFSSRKFIWIYIKSISTLIFNTSTWFCRSYSNLEADVLGFWHCGFHVGLGINMRLGGRKGMKKLEEEGFLDVYDRNGKFEFRVVKSDVEERLATDMHKACLEIPENCRVLNVHGAADEIVPVKEVHEFHRRIRNSTVQIIDGANHNFQLKQEDVARLVVEFVRSSPKQPLRASLWVSCENLAALFVAILRAAAVISHHDVSCFAFFLHRCCCVSRHRLWTGAHWLYSWGSLRQLLRYRSYARIPWTSVDCTRFLWGLDTQYRRQNEGTSQTKR